MSSPYRVLHGHGRACQLTLAIAALVAACAQFAFGEDGIIVHSSGSASARPTQVEMSAKLTADAELAADASVKFRDAKKRALATLAALKNPNLSVIAGGITVASTLDSNQQQMLAMRGFATSAGNQHVRITETSRIVLTEADKLEPEELMDKLLKILDVAKDAGFTFTLPPTNDYYEMQARAQEGQVVFLFKLPDTAGLRKQAYKVALDGAKARANDLTELSATKLGRIVSVQESAGGNNQGIVYYRVPTNSAAGEDDALTSTASGLITLRVNLTVQFEIAK